MPKKYQVLWTKSAHEDLSSIIDYIADNSIDRALNILNSIRNTAKSLDTYPNKGRIVPELKLHNIESYRELIISPWRLIYRIEKSNVYVFAIFDGRRNLEDILLERVLK